MLFTGQNGFADGRGALNLKIHPQGLLSISFMFQHGNPGGREGVQKYAFHRGGGRWWGFFWNNPFNIFLFHLHYKRNGEQLNGSYWVTEALGTLNFIGLLYIISSHDQSLKHNCLQSSYSIFG